MLGAAIVVFREALEAAMITGVIAAATRGVAGSARWLGAGLVAGIVGSLGVAALTERIAQLAEGTGQELFNAIILGIAVAMLAWHNIWMSRHGAKMAREAKGVGLAVSAGDRTLFAVFIVVTVAVLREGSETVLFLYGTLVGGQGSVGGVLTGGVLGLAAGALAGFALYAGFLRIPAKWFFSATSALILLLAAAMAGQMARALVQADLLPSLASPAWDTSTLLANDSTLGALLHVLAGYEARPAGIQVVFYLSAFLLILTGMAWVRRPISRTS